MKWIVGYGGRYKIDIHGNVYSFIANGHKGKMKQMKQQTDKHGYKRISLFYEDKYRVHMVHRLVAITYLSNPYKKPEVNHMNGIKTDNRLSNLEWVTPSENSRHAVNLGLQTNIHSRKFSNSNIKKIKSLYEDGLSFRMIAKKYNVQHKTISNIIKGISYKGVV